MARIKINYFRVILKLLWALIWEIVSMPIWWYGVGFRRFAQSTYDILFNFVRGHIWNRQKVILVLLQGVTLIFGGLIGLILILLWLLWPLGLSLLFFL